MVVSGRTVMGDDLTLNYVGLPVETTEWNDTFTVDDYTALGG